MKQLLSYFPLLQGVAAPFQPSSEVTAKIVYELVGSITATMIDGTVGLAPSGHETLFESAVFFL